MWKLEKVIGAIVLGVLSVAALHYGETELAGVGIGALATWVLKNGVENAKRS